MGGLNLKPSHKWKASAGCCSRLSSPLSTNQQLRRGLCPCCKANALALQNCSCYWISSFYPLLSRQGSDSPTKVSRLGWLESCLWILQSFSWLPLSLLECQLTFFFMCVFYLSYQPDMDAQVLVVFYLLLFVCVQTNLTWMHRCWLFWHMQPWPKTSLPQASVSPPSWGKG